MLEPQRAPGVGWKLQEETAETVGWKHCKSLSHTAEEKHPAAGREGMGEEERKAPGVRSGQVPQFAVLVCT